MLRVVFVVPSLEPDALAHVNAVSRLPDVLLALVSREPAERLPMAIRQRTSAHAVVRDIVDAGLLARAVEDVARALGGVDRLIAASAPLEVQLGQVRDHLGIAGMNATQARALRDSSRTRDALEHLGIRCTRHIIARSAADARAAAHELGFPLLVSLTDCAVEALPYCVQSRGQLGRVLAFLGPGPERAVTIEEQISGLHHTLAMACERGRLVWDAHVRYWPAPVHRLERSWMQWTAVLPRERRDADTEHIRPLARAALQALGLDRGLCHVHWVHGERGPVFSGITSGPFGPRILPLGTYAHDIEFHDVWACSAVFDSVPVLERAYAAGAVFVRGNSLQARSGESGGAGRITAIRGLDRVYDELGHLVVETNLPRPDRAEAGNVRGESYLIVRHPDTETVENALEQIMDMVEIEVA
jgi:hypothetical protein